MSCLSNQQANGKIYSTICMRTSSWESLTPLQDRQNGEGQGDNHPNILLADLLTLLQIVYTTLLSTYSSPRIFRPSYSPALRDHHHLRPVPNLTKLGPAAPADVHTSERYGGPKILVLDHIWQSMRRQSVPKPKLSISSIIKILWHMKWVSCTKYLPLK